MSVWQRRLRAPSVNGLFLLVGLLPLLAVQSVPDAFAHGPKVRDCAEITDAIFSYDVPTVHAVVNTEAPTCPGVVYSLEVLDHDQQTPLGDASARGTREGSIDLSVPDIVSSGSEPVVCAYVTSSAGPKLLDRFPQQGCITPPSCADIVDGSMVYDGVSLVFLASTASPSCPGVTYSLSVFGTIVVGSNPFSFSAVYARPGNNTTNIEFPLGEIGLAPSLTIWLCVSGEASVDGHTLDRAPDSGVACSGSNPGEPMVVILTDPPVHIEAWRGFN